MSTLPDQHRLWGAHLFVPANSAGHLTRLPLLPVRSVILDLEAATPLEQKHEARYLCRRAIAHLREIAPAMHITVRVNIAAAGTLQKEDLEQVVQAGPHAIRVPSINHPAELRRIDDLIAALERRHGVPEGSIALHPMIETPAGLRRAASIATASPRCQALCLGGEDFSRNVGFERTPEGREIDYARSALVSAAAEAKVFAIDAVYTWLEDVDGFRADCQRSRLFGFRGRASTNPRQLAVMTEVYRPSPTERAWAEQLLGALEERVVGGRRIYVSRGVIIDALAVFQARANASWKEPPA